MDTREEKRVAIAEMPDLAALSFPLVIGLDKWTLESLVPKPFLWIAEPFEGTGAAGFIKPGTSLKKDFPLMVLVALDDAPPREDLFHLRRIVFHASEWHRYAAIAATRVSDIFLVRGGKTDLVKSGWRMKLFGKEGAPK